MPLRALHYASRQPTLKDLLLRDPEHTENRALSLEREPNFQIPRVLRGPFVHEDDDHEVDGDDDDGEA